MIRPLLRLAQDPQLWRFGVIGVSATVIQMTLFVCIEPFLSPEVAAVSAFVPAMLCNHALNHFWNFRPDGSRWARSLLRYLPVSLLGLLFNFVIMAVVVRVLLLPPLLGIVIILAVVPLITFFLSRSFSFAPVRGALVAESCSDG